MSRGVSCFATAPCPATPAVPAPLLLRVTRHLIQSAHHFLSIVTIAAVLTLAFPAADATAGATVSTVRSQGAQTTIQSHSGSYSESYGAWSCRGAYHLVRRGETLYSIARRYGTTAYRIAVCNGLASYTVYVGQTLLVPTGR